MKAFHPDDSGMLPADHRRRRNEEDDKNRNKPRGLLAAFLPGDKRALADQMVFGFGGDPQAYRQQLNRLYSPMPVNFKYGKGGGFGMGMPQPIDPQQAAAQVVLDGTGPNWRTSPPGRNF